LLLPASRFRLEVFRQKLHFMSAHFPSHFCWLASRTLLTLTDWEFSLSKDYSDSNKSRSDVGAFATMNETGYASRRPIVAGKLEKSANDSESGVRVDRLTHLSTFGYNSVDAKCDKDNRQPVLFGVDASVNCFVE